MEKGSPTRTAALIWSGYVPYSYSSTGIVSTVVVLFYFVPVFIDRCQPGCFSSFLFKIDSMRSFFKIRFPVHWYILEGAKGGKDRASDPNCFFPIFRIIEPPTPIVWISFSRTCISCQAFAESWEKSIAASKNNLSQGVPPEEWNGKITLRLFMNVLRVKSWKMWIPCKPGSLPCSLSQSHRTMPGGTLLTDVAFVQKFRFEKNLWC